METENQEFFLSQTSLIVIDSNIEGYEDLVTGVFSNTEILILDRDSDGIAQITEALSNYEEVASIQIISHGDSGSIQLGNTFLSLDNLQQYQDDLLDWGKTLSDDGDILAYGCNVAEGEGINFINALRDITGADVAASTDITGDSDAMGDWDLEYATGEIEADLALSPQTTSSFEGTLHEGTEYAVEEDPNFQNESVLSGLDSAVSMEFLPDGRLLILEKNGTVKITDPDSGGGTSDYLVITDILTSGEKGLIDIAIDPDFESNGQIYLYYTAGSTREFRISSFTHQGNTADPNSEQILWEDPNVASGPDHFGGGLSFGPDGRLYLTTGDKASGSFSQDLTRAEGKIIRINKDGSIPEDNPFNDGDGPNLDEIWAIGLRNPFRSEWDLTTGEFFIGDVGQDDQEEINRITLSDAGGNFGWPFVEGDIVNQQPPAGTQLIDPIFTYEHTDDQFGSGAVIGGIVYRGNAFPSQFQGAYFFADYTQDFIKYMTFDGGIDVDNFDRGIRAGGSTGRVDNVVSIDEGPDGALYYINFGSELRRITYNTTGNQAPTIDSATADVTSGASPLTINFSGAATDAEGDTLEYRWIFGDGTEATGANVSHTYDDNGNYSATLIVSDGNSDTQSEPIEIAIGSAPDAAITLPSDNGTFRAGDTIDFSGTATDNGPLTPDDYAWEIDFIHDDHQHPRENFTGTGGSFVIPTTRTSGHDFSSFTGYEINLTVTDTDGLQDTETISIFPEKVDVTFGSNVPGDIVFTIDEIPRTTSSFVYDTAIDFQHVISVPETVNIGGTQYTFESWSNGETTPEIVFTVPETDANLTANYTESGGGTGGGTGGGDLTEIFSDSFESSTVGNSPAGWNGNGWTVKTAAGEYDNTSGNFTNADGSNIIEGTGPFGTLVGVNRAIDITGNENSDLVISLLANDGGGGDTTLEGGDIIGVDYAFGETAPSNAQWINGISAEGDIADGNGMISLTSDGAINPGGQSTLWLRITQRVSSGSESFAVDRIAVATTDDPGTGGGGNTAPVASGDSFEVTPDSNNNPLNILANDSDADGDPLTITNIGTPDSGGAVEINPNGEGLVYTPAVGFSGIDTFEYTIADPDGLTDTALVAVTVGDDNTGGGENTAPVASGDSFEVTTDSNNNPLNILANDSDADGDPLTFTILTDPVSGVAMVDDNGTPGNLNDDFISYTPNAGFTGNDSLTYEIADGNGGTAQADVAIAVSDDNTGGGDPTEIFSDSFESSTVGNSPAGWNGDGWTVKTAAGEYDNTSGNFANADGSNIIEGTGPFGTLVGVNRAIDITGNENSDLVISLLANDGGGGDTTLEGGDILGVDYAFGDTAPSNAEWTNALSAEADIADGNGMISLTSDSLINPGGQSTLWLRITQRVNSSSESFAVDRIAVATA